MDNTIIKPFIIIFAVIAIAVVVIFIPSYITNKNSFNQQIDKSALVNTDSILEWISPDGVHYWYYMFGYRGFMVPRYDKNGNIMIDK